VTTHPSVTSLLSKVRPRRRIEHTLPDGKRRVVELTTSGLVRASTLVDGVDRMRGGISPRSAHYGAIAIATVAERYRGERGFGSRRRILMQLALALEAVAKAADAS